MGLKAVMEMKGEPSMKITKEERKELIWDVSREVSEYSKMPDIGDRMGKYKTRRFLNGHIF